jgi:phosphoribosyl-AMP cyclohydrolase
MAEFWRSGYMTGNAELGTQLQLKFDANGLITAIAVDAHNGEVLMVAFMNDAALQKTLQTGMATYWSRSRQKFWVKGEESGHVQLVKQVLIDCDQDAVILKVEQRGAACHNGFRTCFYRTVTTDGNLELVQKPIVDPAAIYTKK